MGDEASRMGPALVEIQRSLSPITKNFKEGSRVTHTIHEIGVAKQTGSYSDAIAIKPHLLWLMTSGALAYRPPVARSVGRSHRRIIRSQPTCVATPSGSLSIEAPLFEEATPSRYSDRPRERSSRASI